MAIKGAGEAERAVEGAEGYQALRSKGQMKFA